MNLSAMPELLLAWVKTQGAALLQGNKAQQASPFKVGATYEGKVLDQMPGGRHLVQVAGQKLDMGLPRNTQTGDSVRLTFLNGGPRPTFLLNQTQVAPVQQVRLSNAAQQVNALMRVAQPSAQGPAQAASQATVTTTTTTAAVPPGTASQAQAASQLPGGAALVKAGPASTLANLAAAGQSVRALPGAANTPAPGAHVQAAARPIVANVVMLQGASTAQSAAPIAVASANTGLLGQAVDGLRAAVPASTNLRPTVVADVSTPSPNLLPTRLAQALRESGLFYESHLTRWGKGAYPFESILNEPQARLARGGLPMQGLAELGGMPKEVAQMAGRQLQMLEGGPFLWQGFAWPGQWMNWLVEERQGWQEGEAEDEAANPWSTELRLTLPRMGAVQAQLSLRGHDVNLRLQVSEPATAQTLNDALPELQRGLQSAGLQAVSLAVVSGEVSSGEVGT
jgi:hypothetical protein